MLQLYQLREMGIFELIAMVVSIRWGGIGFEDVFDVEYFIQKMNGFVQVVRELPAELASKEGVANDWLYH
ncbi:hypothetical protein ACS0TY_009420 [Phlomoides rotata]